MLEHDNSLLILLLVFCCKKVSFLSFVQLQTGTDKISHLSKSCKITMSEISNTGKSAEVLPTKCGQNIKSESAKLCRMVPSSVTVTHLWMIQNDYFNFILYIVG